MWRWIKRSVLGLVILILGLLLHYVLPQRDVVRIAGTEVIRMDFTPVNRWFYAQADAGNVDGTMRDVRLINAVRPNDRVKVYRNEDTGWIWPPYFKFASSNLQAEAQDLISTKAAPQWVVVRYYGWRIPFLSIYPNAVSIRAIDDPNVTLIPWFNIIFLTVLAGFVIFIWGMLARFRRRAVDPFVDRVDARADAAALRARGVWGRFTGWLGTWRGKPRV